MADYQGEVDGPRRPFSVTVAVVLTWISAIGSLLGGILFIVIARDPAELRTLGITSTTAWTAAVIGLVLGLVTAAVANGLSSGRRFSRFLVTLLMLARIASSFWNLAEFGSGQLFNSIASILAAAIVLFLLWNLRARRFFRRS